MTRQYRRELAPSLRLDLTRLEKGTAAEKQRYYNTADAILKVLSNPLSHEFSKNLPDGYKAVDVLQQYRLFFKILDHELLSDSVVYFVWLNSEESIHRTGKADDCYEVFRKKVENGEIEPFTPDEEPINKFKLHGSWTDKVVYASLVKTLKSSAERANSHLHLSEVTRNEFKIISISVSKENIGLASDLLLPLCSHADQARVTLTYEIFLAGMNVLKSKHLLKKFGFEMVESIEDVEAWVRTPKAPSIPTTIKR